MAVRRKNQTRRRGDTSLGCLFWIGFLLLIVGLFLFNRELIRRTLENTKFFDRILNKPTAEGPAAPPGETAPPGEAEPVDAAPPAAGPSAGQEPIVEAPAPEAGHQSPSTSEEPIVVEGPAEKPDAKPAQKPAAPSSPAETSPKPEGAVPQRDRSLWFVRLDDDGVIARTKTVRSLPSSDSPLVDTLTALLAGPSATEKKKGLSSLIPQGTKLLSAIVRGDTAYLSFSEEFQFNTYGIEGYAAQLRQIVWTATEFPTVKKVQILIEGRRVDYLGSEGIWIGAPIGRDSL